MRARLQAVWAFLRGRGAWVWFVVAFAGAYVADQFRSASTARKDSRVDRRITAAHGRQETAQAEAETIRVRSEEIGDRIKVEELRSEKTSVAIQAMDAEDVASEFARLAKEREQ